MAENIIFQRRSTTGCRTEQMDNPSKLQAEEKPSSIRVEKINDFEGLKSLKGIWNELLERSDSNSIYLTYEWITTYWKHFGGGKRLYILLVKEQDEVIGIAPLMQIKTRFLGLPVRKLQFIATGPSDCQDFISTKKKKLFLQEIMNYILRKSSDWDILDLREIPSNSETIPTIEEVINNSSCIFEKVVCSICPYLSLNTDWKNYWQSLSSRTRSTLRNRTNKLNSLGKLNFKRYSTTPQTDSLMRKIFELERESGKEKKGIAVLTSQRNQNFYLEVTRHFSDKKWLDLSFLEINNQPVSYFCSFRYGKKLCTHLTAYDVKYAKFSPGMVLMYYLLEDSFRRPMEEFDFSRGNHAYKRKWTKSDRSLFRIMVFNKRRRINSKILYFLEFKLIQTIKENKYLYRWIAKLKNRKNKWKI